MLGGRWRSRGCALGGALEVMPVSVRGGAMEVSALACTCVHRNASKTFAGNHSKHISVYLCVSQSF